MLKIILYFIPVLAICHSEAVIASQNCSGKISDVLVSRNGDLLIAGSWNNASVKICNVNSDWNSVSINTCKGWLSISQTAFVAEKEVVIRNPVTSCSEASTYSPEYLKIR